MVICPKCGFDQPPDRYCASCGINLENYKGKRQSAFRAAPLLFLGVAVGLVVITVLFMDKFKNWDLGKFYPESEITDSQTSANFGAASDLQLEGQATPSADVPAAPIGAKSAQAPIAASAENNPPKDFHPSVTFVIGEITDVEINQLLVTKENSVEPDTVIWGVSDDIPLIRRAHMDRDLKLNFGENKINYEDEFARFDISFEITNVTGTIMKAKVRYNRSLGGFGSDEQASFDVTIPQQKTVYIIDRLPRIREAQSQIAATNSLLGLLYKSRTFLEETSEVGLLVQFE